VIAVNLPDLSCQSFIIWLEKWIEIPFISLIPTNRLIKKLVTQNYRLITVLRSNGLPYFSCQLSEVLAFIKECITKTVVNVDTSSASRWSMHVNDNLEAMLLAPLYSLVNMAESIIEESNVRPFLAEKQLGTEGKPHSIETDLLNEFDICLLNIVVSPFLPEVKSALWV
jgi:hypothetical protein